MAGLIGKQIRDAVYARLADKTTGFNATLAALEDQYGIGGYTIEFARKIAPLTFLVGSVDYVELEGSTLIQTPLMVLWTQGARDLAAQKFLQFSGTVDCLIEVHLTHPANDIRTDMLESLADMTIDALIQVIARRENQNWGNEIGYAGRVSANKSPLIRDDVNWRRVVTAIFPFECHTPNVGG